MRATAVVTQAFIIIAALLLDRGTAFINPNSVRCAAEELKSCRCNNLTHVTEISCHGVGLTGVPSSLPSSLIKLDLSSNNITQLYRDSFANLINLEELWLNDNVQIEIHSDAFANNIKLKQLSLRNCGIKNVSKLPLNGLVQLTTLQLDRNKIEKVSESDFDKVAQIRELRLDGNHFTSVPTNALNALKSLKVLSIGSNQLSSIPSNAFPKLPNLTTLVLKRNHINAIDEDAFVNLTSLEVLELGENALQEIPIAVTKLASLQELSVSGNRITYIPEGILQKSQNLTLLELKGNPLKDVDPFAFSNLPQLKTLIISEARELKEFPSLNGTSALKYLRLDRASIFTVPSTLCRTCPKLKTLDLKFNKLGRIPNISECKDLRVLDMGNNYIGSLDGQLFSELSNMLDLILPNNLITEIPEDAFKGLKELRVLNLEENLIEYIHPNAFTSTPKLQDLNLGENVFSELPVKGLRGLLYLKTFNNANLRDFPAPENFPNIQDLVLSYAYHCCAFLARDTPPPHGLSEIIIPANDVDKSLWYSNSSKDVWPQRDNTTGKFGTQTKDILESYGTDFTYPGNMQSYSEEYEEQQEKYGDSSDNTLLIPVGGRIRCLPTPGPFLPCQDLFDWWTLRCGVWVVFLLAMLGNGTVVFVLIFSRSKFDVPRFLVCNLAAADFFMGVYLGFLAVVDAGTLGEFRMYAIRWQRSGWCQLCGIFAVFSSELSVYTLAVITLERNYAITHAMHLNKRLSLKHASYIMLIGWSFAVFTSLMPLFGVSDYRKYATCLPFETTTGPWSVTYVVFLNFVNGVAFLILMGCYLKMYCAIRGSQAWNSNDSRIAKRMALLVFTDFLCWSPIAFFSLTAIAGYQFVTLEQAKVFTVFVLPLNSCCNPFLYAILTKQFKKDCVLICKAIEESRVTRGIGRCRHSSNFSNRQTPANTNSLVDRSSRDNYVHAQPCTCQTKLLNEKHHAALRQQRDWKQWLGHKLRVYILCDRDESDVRHMMRSDQYAYQIAEIQQKQHKRASSMSSSENYSSSRSDSWRQTHHHCGIPMRLLDPKRRALSWVVTRKTSQDSNLSSSRNDSSGSGNTASTSLSRISRSSAGGGESKHHQHHQQQQQQQKPKLTRQSAIVDEADLLTSPAKLTVRFLATIPSATENSVLQEDENGTVYAILHPSPEQSPDNSPRSLSPSSQVRSFSPIAEKSKSK